MPYLKFGFFAEMKKSEPGGGHVNPVVHTENGQFPAYFTECI
jgi:hypothetical protein